MTFPSMTHTHTHTHTHTQSKNIKKRRNYAYILMELILQRRAKKCWKNNWSNEKIQPKSLYMQEKFPDYYFWCFRYFLFSFPFWWLEAEKTVSVDLMDPLPRGVIRSTQATHTQATAGRIKIHSWRDKKAQMKGHWGTAEVYIGTAGNPHCNCFESTLNPLKIHIATALNPLWHSGNPPWHHWKTQQKKIYLWKVESHGLLQEFPFAIREKKCNLRYWRVCFVVTSR